MSTVDKLNSLLHATATSKADAVSYTHLDVYKRQVYARDDVRFAFKDGQEIRA